MKREGITSLGSLFFKCTTTTHKVHLQNDKVMKQNIHISVDTAGRSNVNGAIILLHELLGDTE